MRVLLFALVCATALALPGTPAGAYMCQLAAPDDPSCNGGKAPPKPPIRKVKGKSWQPSITTDYQKSIGNLSASTKHLIVVTCMRSQGVVQYSMNISGKPEFSSRMQIMGGNFDGDYNNFQMGASEDTVWNLSDSTLNNVAVISEAMRQRLKTAETLTLEGWNERQRNIRADFNLSRGRETFARFEEACATLK